MNFKLVYKTNVLQLCLSVPAAKLNVGTTSEAPVETTTSASPKSIENLTNEQILALMKEWGEEARKPNITQAEKENLMVSLFA